MFFSSMCLPSSAILQRPTKPTRPVVHRSLGRLTGWGSVYHKQWSEMKPNETNYKCSLMSTKDGDVDIWQFDHWSFFFFFWTSRKVATSEVLIKKLVNETKSTVHNWCFFGKGRVRLRLGVSERKHDRKWDMLGGEENPKSIVGRARSRLPVKFYGGLPCFSQGCFLPPQGLAAIGVSRWGQWISLSKLPLARQCVFCCLCFSGSCSCVYGLIELSSLTLETLQLVKEKKDKQWLTYGLYFSNDQISAFHFISSPMSCHFMVEISCFFRALQPFCAYFTA